MKKLNFDVRGSCERILNSVHVVMWVFSEGTSSLCVSLLAGTFPSELTLPIKKNFGAVYKDPQNGREI